MTTKKTPYKVLNVELEEILSKLQSSELDMDDAVKLYERGMEVAKELETYLKESENKVTKIKADWESKG